MVLPFNPETVELIISPQWFCGIDNLFAIFSALTAFLISFYSHQIYRLNKKRNYIWFSLSLFLMGLAFIAQIITNFMIFYPQIIDITFGQFAIVYALVKQSNILFILGTLSFRLLMLAGFFGVYWLISKSKEKNKFPLFAFLLFTTTLLSAYAYIIFYITMVILLAHIVYYYNINYKKTKNSKTLMILWSFALLLLSQIVFILLFLDVIKVYVASEIIQSLGYILLLYSYYLIVKGK